MTVLTQIKAKGYLNAHRNNHDRMGLQFLQRAEEDRYTGLQNFFGSSENQKSSSIFEAYWKK